MPQPVTYDMIVVGGGPAGYFAAIRSAELRPNARVCILEATHRPLLKVLISGGGRCNVTHHCFDPAELVKAYPRGSQELRGPFSRFQAKDTVNWFESRGVQLKAETDGRMFPVTDQSSSIADCLQAAASGAGVEVNLGARVKSVICDESTEASRFELHMKDGAPLHCRTLLLSTGSTPSGYKIASSLGHTITPLAPSLFTFNIVDKRIEGLAGVSVQQVHLRLNVLDAAEFSWSGPLLVTHWGMSGPAVLKLSAWAARELLRSNYQATLTVDWLGGQNQDAVRESLKVYRSLNSKKLVATEGPFFLPRRLWSRLVEAATVPSDLTWANLSREQLTLLTQQITAGQFAVSGKGEFKEEFVTCGGVDLREVDFRTMESKRCPGLYFAGEILDIDGITGGFNFQAAWTTGWIAGSHMVSHG